jgi:RNA polymerase sigma factor for flagellar operon FliA
MKAMIDRYRYAKRNEKEFIDRSDRDELIRKHAPLVKFIAERFSIRLPAHISVEELISAGTMGLFDAINNFDSSKGIKFKTYATYRIKGAILDELRRLDWVPRSVRRDIHKFEKAVNDAWNKHGREPDDIEIAQELGVDSKQYFKMLQRAQGLRLISADEIKSDGANSIYDKIATEKPSQFDEYRKKELGYIIAKTLKKLTKKEQLVISLYYYDELTLKEIAAVLGLTESRISQIHSKVIISLRSKLKPQYLD